jgi:hypothetical protein
MVNQTPIQLLVVKMPLVAFQPRLNMLAHKHHKNSPTFEQTGFPSNLRAPKYILISSEIIAMASNREKPCVAFQEATNVVKLDSNTYQVNLHEDFSIGAAMKSHPSSFHEKSPQF